MPFVKTVAGPTCNVGEVTEQVGADHDARKPDTENLRGPQVCEVPQVAECTDDVVDDCDLKGIQQPANAESRGDGGVHAIPARSVESP